MKFVLFLTTLFGQILARIKFGDGGKWYFFAWIEFGEAENFLNLAEPNFFPYLTSFWTNLRPKMPIENKKIKFGVDLI